MEYDDSALYTQRNQGHLEKRGPFNDSAADAMTSRH